MCERECVFICADSQDPDEAVVQVRVHGLHVVKSDGFAE